MSVLMSVRIFLGQWHICSSQMDTLARSFRLPVVPRIPILKVIGPWIAI